MELKYELATGMATAEWNMCAVDIIGTEKPIAPPTASMRKRWMNGCGNLFPQLVTAMRKN